MGLPLLVLVIDDNAVEGALLSGLLKKLTRWEISPVVHTNGTRAMEWLGSHQPDLVFMDYMLGHESGTTIIRQMKQQGCQAGFILFTGLEGEEAIVEALRAGADDYLRKTELNIETLSRSIHHSLERVNADQMLRKTMQSLQQAKKDLEQRVMQRTQELSEAHEQLNIITSSARDAIVMLDPDSRIIFWNPAAERVFGFASEDVIGHEINYILDPATHTITLEHRSSLSDSYGSSLLDTLVTLATSQPPQTVVHSPHHHQTPSMVIEATATHKQRERFPVEGSFSAVRLRDAWYAVGILRDITQRKAHDYALQRAKEEAEEATRLKDKFVSLVVHDLRGPFTTILGFLELLESDRKNPLSKRQKSFLDWITESSKKMLQIIDELLNISRLKTGKIVPIPRFFDSRVVIGQTLESLTPPATNKKIQLVNTIPDGVRLYADPALFNQVIHNLISNAIKFSHPGHKITIHIPENEMATVAVSDTGTGIAPERLGKLFLLEEKTSTPGTAGEHGTGFGLPLSLDLVKAHQGTIDVVSTPGEGSTFFVRLPEIIPDVLVVDDDPDQRLLLARHLGRLKMAVHEAEDGIVALEMIRNRTYHLIICDVVMPKMNGFTLLKTVRESGGNRPVIPFIMMTGDSQLETRERSFQTGADDFITKPIDPTDLLPRVRRFLG
ncbi:MAG: response regulator [Magnetococcales bacterium]|nr:response regulator [Magnetococcales bacterium]